MNPLLVLTFQRVEAVKTGESSQSNVGTSAQERGSTVCSLRSRRKRKGLLRFRAGASRSQITLGQKQHPKTQRQQKGSEAQRGEHVVLRMDLVLRRRVILFQLFD
jgi:hypothetical protein